jgi:hypothetical protein
VAFVLCKNGAQRNAQNKGRFLGQLQRLVRFVKSTAFVIYDDEQHNPVDID